MKRIAIGIALSLAMSGAAFAAGEAAKNTGCGFGTLLWENKADNSSLFQAFQATTNGSSGSQTFGISSGTLNCDQPSKFVRNEKLMHFVQANMDNLAKDVAMGRGETLDAFAELLGVAPGEAEAFKAKLQSNFGKVFTSEQVVLADVIDNAVTISRN
ncbi:DUF3015 family protein [Geobacter sp. DSM 9736]|uniref:DUF3015 family protein n=1 Tax=Geobacter sp. DSM 9736 TaxID=1277350 RepID=UPI000B50D9EC|nr:DUF3015 family protein [Geobacter sp. DSM 9736]SNB47129.1 Protein of unknown function [Geobacter sp. DSM 9736]